MMLVPAAAARAWGGAGGAPAARRRPAARPLHHPEPALERPPNAALPSPPHHPAPPAARAPQTQSWPIGESYTAWGRAPRRAARPLARLCAQGGGAAGLGRVEMVGRLGGPAAARGGRGRQELGSAGASLRAATCLGNCRGGRTGGRGAARRAAGPARERGAAGGGGRWHPSGAPGPRWHSRGGVWVSDGAKTRRLASAQLRTQDSEGGAPERGSNAGGRTERGPRCGGPAAAQRAAAAAARAPPPPPPPPGRRRAAS
jgi:hypothetical protein